jgi:membrane protease subunit HflK
MPWSNNNGGGGGWKGGGPWGNGPSGGPSPDLEEFLKRSQDRIKQAMPGSGMSGGLLAVLILAVFAVVGFYSFTVSIKPDEQGIVLRFGKYDRFLGAGLNFRWPYPVEHVDRVPVTRINRIEIGYRAGGAGSGDSSYSASESLRDVPKESLMLTGDENIVDVDFVVFWTIKSASDYLFNLQNPKDTVQAVAESAMREVVGQNDITPILTKSRKVTEDGVLALMQKTLDTYGAGVHVTQVQMQKVDPPEQVIAAFRGVQAARADQERMQNEAQSYANKIVPEARGETQKILQAANGYKEQTVAEAKGRTSRFLKVYDEYAKAPDVTRKRMYLETMERVLGGMDKIIIDNKGGGSGVVPYLPLQEIAPKRHPAGGQ